MGWGADTRDHKRTPGGTLTPMGSKGSGCVAVVLGFILAVVACTG